MRHPLCRILKRTRGQVSVPLLFSDLLSHDAKIAGNNLAWKDIGFMPDVEEEKKKNERYVENVDGKSEFYSKTIKIVFLGKIYTNISWRFKIYI